MKFINHKSISSIEKIILFFLNVFAFIRAKNVIRILVYHNIESKHILKFKHQLKSLKKDWNFISAKEFEDHIKKKKILKGRNLLITFDDGFKSNYFIAKKILKNLEIKAIFFVPSDFIKIKSKSNTKKFIEKNILDNQKIKNQNKLKNMTPKDLKFLIKNGHTIGNHTKTHADLGAIKKKIKLKREILNSAKDLENILNVKINHFAYTYGNYNNMSYDSLKIALSKHHYVYSCFRGNNYFNKEHDIIKRDTIYLNSSNDLLKIFLSGFLDLKYFLDKIRVNKMIIKILNK